MMARKTRRDSAPERIVSSAHLGSGAMPALSELEFGMIVLGHAFERWIIRCMAAAGEPDLSPLDVLVLHTIAHSAAAKSAADICLVLDIEIKYLVTYSLKKLDAHRLLSLGRGSGKTVSLTPKGDRALQRFREVRQALLVKSAKSAGFDPKGLIEITGLMRTLSGHYDQAARAVDG